MLRIFFAGKGEKDGRDDIVCLAVNTFWEEQQFSLLGLPEGESWHMAVDTGGRYLQAFIPDKGIMEKYTDNTVIMAPRSVCILVN